MDLNLVQSLVLALCVKNLAMTEKTIKNMNESSNWEGLERTREVPNDHFLKKIKFIKRDVIMNFILDEFKKKLIENNIEEGDTIVLLTKEEFEKTTFQNPGLAKKILSLGWEVYFEEFVIDFDKIYINEKDFNILYQFGKRSRWMLKDVDFMNNNKLKVYPTLVKKKEVSEKELENLAKEIFKK